MNVPADARKQARERLRPRQKEVRRLVLLHTLISLGFLFLITCVDYLLSERIANLGGLSGLGTQSVLQTAQTLLRYAVQLLIPFWELGMIVTAIRFAREQSAEPDALLSPFRRFFPVLRMMLLRYLRYGIVLFLCIQLSSFLFVMTPLSQGLEETITPLMTAHNMQNPDLLLQLVMENLNIWDLVPLFAILVVLLLLLFVPLFYRFRMTDYLIMDAAYPKAFATLRASQLLMQGNCWALFRLDLKFWWYYALQLVGLLLSYSNLLLPLLGVSLPFSEDIAVFISLGLYCIFSLGLNVWARGYVETAYGIVYDSLLQDSPLIPRKDAEKND